MSDTDYRDAVYFNSNAREPFHMLSNLSAAEVKLSKLDVTPELLEVNPSLLAWLGEETFCFPSIEHVWHALKATSKEVFDKFHDAGELAQFTTEAFALFFPKDDQAEKKLNYWSRKNNVGIIPKLASNEKYGKRLGIAKSMNYKRERLEPRLERAGWKTLLHKKYAGNKTHAFCLKTTRNAKLVEFARSAARAGAQEHWGGYINNGVLSGDNVMGLYLEEVRGELPRE